MAGVHDVSFERALVLVREHAAVLPTQVVAVGACAGRRATHDVVARRDHPAYDNSAMDGYAVRAADLPGRVRVVGESRAGAGPAGRIAAGEAARISTGAPLPPGADAVLRSEDAVEDGGWVSAGEALAPGTFVRLRGGDLRAGDLLLAGGEVAPAHAVAALAAAGPAEIECRRRPRVALLVTGDELVEPGAAAGFGQVVDANGPGVAAQVVAAGAELAAVARAPDDLTATVEAVGGLLDGAGGAPPDVLITIGGVSVGRHDHVRPAMRAAGVAELLFGVEVRPGHPLWLGARGAQRALGLPGNPVSAAVCFHVFGRALLGRPARFARLAPLAAPYRPVTPRAELVRCGLGEEGALEPMAHQASHAVSGLLGAEALAWVPAGSGELPAGARLRYEPLT